MGDGSVTRVFAHNHENLNLISYPQTKQNRHGGL